MGKFLDRGIDMAAHTFNLFVDGFRENPHVHKKRNLLASAFGGEARIGVAFKAGFLGLGVQKLSAENKKKSHDEPA
jgi:hypothetical protein